MTVLNEYLQAGLKVVEKWRPQVQARLVRKAAEAPYPRDARKPAENDPNSDIETSALSEDGAPADVMYEGPWPPALKSLMAQVTEQNGLLPAHSLTLGACEDGLPFLLDLTNPAPGALLVCGDTGSGKTRLLQTVLASGVSQNPAQNLQVSVLADDPDAYMDFAGYDHCQEIFAVDDPAAIDLINELHGLVDERRRNQPPEPAILLVIDGLEGLVNALDPETVSRLCSLVRHGPRCRVWTVAGLDARRYQGLEPRLLASFRTRLLGRMRNRHTSQDLTGSEMVDARDLESGLFLVPYGEEWLRLWACELESTPEED